jgi:mono/diheme cytochrome c family protein
MPFAKSVAAPLALAASLLLAALPGAAQETKDGRVSFTASIKPVLREKCAHCHNLRTLPERVSFESRELAFTKTAAGQPIIVPGKPEESLLVVALESPKLHEKAMPMVGPRPNVDEIALIRRWIAEGARWPKGPAGRIRPYFYAKE